MTSPTINPRGQQEPPIPDTDVSKTLDLERTLDAEAYAAEIRARRGNILPMESPLAFVGSPPPGWTWRWVNDVDNSVETRLIDGWRFVTKDRLPAAKLSVGKGSADIGSQVSVPTVLGDGKPIKTILMEIPTALANELLEVRSLSKVRAFESAITRDGAAPGIGFAPHMYRPSETPGSQAYRVPNTIQHPAA